MKTILAFVLIVTPPAVVETLNASFETGDAAHCYYTDTAGTFARVALPGGHELHLERSSDSSAAATACSATVRDQAGNVVWTAHGFGALLDDWTGRDIDGDGSADAVIAVDTGGGNRCCWAYFVMTLVPRFRQSAAVQFSPLFQVDERGRTLAVELEHGNTRAASSIPGSGTSDVRDRADAPGRDVSDASTPRVRPIRGCFSPGR